MSRASSRIPDLADYAAFLPVQRREALRAPASDWWLWRRHRVHLLRARDGVAPVRLLVVHGAGSHATGLWPLASLMAGAGGMDVTAVDLPLYGATVTDDRAGVRYQDWIDLLVDLVEEEDDGRPLILLGGSIGGLLAVEVAARSPSAASAAATCLLDPRDRHARARMTRFGAAAPPLVPLTRLIRGPLRRIRLPVARIADVARMGRDPELGRLCAADPRGGGARIPLGFLISYLEHEHEAARRAPTRVLLVHPDRDDWTPPALSLNTLATLPGDTRTVMLRGCGHFPLEEPGLQDLVDALTEEGRRLAAERPTGGPGVAGPDTGRPGVTDGEG